MSNNRRRSLWAIIFKRFTFGGANVLAVLGYVDLVTLMLLVVVDVVCRRTPLTAPWGSGGYELTELVMGVLACLALAWDWFAGQHIRIEMVLDRVRPRTRAILNAFGALCSLVFVASISWSMLVRSIDNIGVHQTDVLKIYTWPVLMFFSLVMAHFGVVLVNSLVSYIAMACGRSVEMWTIDKRDERAAMKVAQTVESMIEQSL